MNCKCARNPQSVVSLSLLLFQLQAGLVVMPGDCRRLLLTSSPSYLEGFIEYTVPMTGYISVSFNDKVLIPDADPDKAHYQFGVPIWKLVEHAQASVRPA